MFQSCFCVVKHAQSPPIVENPGSGTVFTLTLRGMSPRSILRKHFLNVIAKFAQKSSSSFLVTTKRFV